MKSVQGRELLLGPVIMPPYLDGKNPEEYLKYWVISEPAVAFDEAKHYGALYEDRLNFAPMMVIRERRPDRDVPIQALYYPKRVKTPNLVDDKTNEGLKFRGYLGTALPLIFKELLR